MNQMKTTVLELLDLANQFKIWNRDVISDSGYMAPSQGNPLYEVLGLYDVGSAEVVEEFCFSSKALFRNDMDAAQGQGLYPLHQCKTIHLVRHAQGFHNVAGEMDHSSYMSSELFDAQLTPLGWQQFIDVGTMVSPIVHVQRSLCYLMCEQPDIALQDAMQAQCIYLEWSTIFYMQAMALAKLNMHKDAADMLNEAAALEEKKQRGGKDKHPLVILLV